MLVQKSFFFKYFTVLFVTIFLSVSYATADTLDNDSNDEKTYDLNIIPKNDPLTQNMSDFKKEVFNKLINKQPIKFSDIKKLLIEEQVRYYNTDKNKSSSGTTAQEIEEQVDNLINSVNEISDITQIKVDMETRFSKSIPYNAIATSLPYIFKENRLNCYSSTLLHLLVVRSNPNFKDQNIVAILKPSHILSGFLTENQDNTSWNLTGIENTTEDTALVDFGNIKDYKFPARFIDADLLIIFEIFKHNISNIEDLIKQILDLTAKKYGLDSSKINDEYFDLNPDKLDETKHNDYTEVSSNCSPLEFFDSKVPEKKGEIKDLERGSIKFMSKEYFEEGRSQHLKSFIKLDKTYIAKIFQMENLKDYTVARIIFKENGQMIVNLIEDHIEDTTKEVSKDRKKTKILAHFNEVLYNSINEKILLVPIHDGKEYLGCCAMSLEEDTTTTDNLDNSLDSTLEKQQDQAS